jgi:hypothetical protein
MKNLSTPLILLLLTGNAIETHGDSSALRVGQFSSHTSDESLLRDWQPLTFKKIDRVTRYRLVMDGDSTVVEAQSQASASGLFHKISIDPQQFPHLRWSWKVGSNIPGSDPRRKDGDDYPARLYITFDYDKSRLSAFERLKYEAYRLFYDDEPPLAAISYIWANTIPSDTVIPNAYTDRVMMIVTQNDAAPTGQWIHNERNIHDDYIRAFGEPPPRISGVAIMTDTDNTGDAVTAFYGDIVFSSRPSDNRGQY